MNQTLSLPLDRVQRPAVQRRVLTIITPAPIRQPEPKEEVPAGWKTCFACRGNGTKPGLWASAGRYGARKCDVCDGGRFVPENEPEPTPDVPAQYGYPEDRVSYED